MRDFGGRTKQKAKEDEESEILESSGKTKPMIKLKSFKKGES